MEIVGVYGTFRKGFLNHFLLEDSEFLGYDFVLVKKIGYDYYPLVSEGKEKMVLIEKYKVDEKQLKIIDFIENHPKFYKRKKKKTLYGDNVRIYYNNKADDKMANWVKDGDFYSRGTPDILYREIDKAIKYIQGLLDKS